MHLIMALYRTLQKY